ncbi:MAG TPA: TolC family protein [Phycisphaerales bacterium]|nr:TolC family protein [Phycisphaerales bacterium]
MSKPIRATEMSSSRWFIAPVLMLGLLAGCTVNQRAEVDTYRAVLDEHAPRERVEAPSTEQPLTLQHALYLANQNDEQLSIRGEQYLQSLIARARAANVFLPSVSASASHNLNVNGSTARNSTSASVGGSIQVFNLRSIRNLEQARVLSEVSRLDLLDLQQTVLLGVANSFYQVLTAEEQVRVLQNSLALRAEQLRDVEARTRLGIARPLDLAQAQADESSTRVSLMQAQSNARQARTTLAFLLGLDYIDNPLADQFAPPTSPRPAIEFEQDAVDHRLDLAAARRSVEVASIGVKGAYAQYYPSVNLNTSFLLYSSAGSGNPWSLTASLLQPVFDAAQTYQDVRDALSGLRQSVMQQDRLARQIHEDVTLAYEDFITSTSKLRELEISVTAAQRAYDLAVAQYRVGNASNLDQLTAQDQLLSAQLQLSNERFNQKLFYLNLLRVTGRFGLNTPSELGLGGT